MKKLIKKMMPTKEGGLLPTFGDSWTLTLSCLAGIILIIITLLTK